MRTFRTNSGELCIFDEFVEPDLLQMVEGLFDRYIKRCLYAECGRNRIVFVMKNYVVKVPISFGGVGDNDWEGSVRSTEESYVKLARTRLCEFEGIPVVFMEKVNYANLPDDLPEWVGSVDCCQVGYNKREDLVAFDFWTN